MTARSTPYNVTCRATHEGQTFSDVAQLSYLPPNPYGGSTVKIDRKSGALLVRNESLSNPQWERLMPFGWYDNYDGQHPSQWYLRRLRTLTRS